MYIHCQDTLSFGLRDFSGIGKSVSRRGGTAQYIPTVNDDKICRHTLQSELLAKYVVLFLWLCHFETLGNLLAVIREEWLLSAQYIN